MKIHNWLMAACLLAMAACKPEIPMEAVPGEAEIYPDYRAVTVPVNIAPLRFKIGDERTEAVAELKIMGGEPEKTGGERIVAAQRGSFQLSPVDWQALTSGAKGGRIGVTVYFRQPGESWKQMSFPIYVSGDSIDSYLIYRRIFPGYRMWNEMGIYQRNVENFVEKPVLDNRSTNNSCMNCHSFQAGNGDRMLFHQRGTHDGTYLINGRQVERIALERDGKPASFGYPYWHPSGRYVAFSTNETHQDFHLADRNRIEVYDMESDVLLYDTERHRAFTVPQLASKGSFETFPSFTPDGRSLIFCSADSVRMPADYRSVRYHLLQVDFFPESGEVGSRVDTLFDADKAGGSARFPRVSPDGRRLLYTVSGYGNFSIWHKDADLRMLDLRTGETDSLPGVNSPDVESYHSWSGNSRWFVFSSRRGDGLFTRPYIVHVDERGRCGKPFLLPQAEPDYYGRSLFSFNIPELARTPVAVSREELVEASRRAETRVVKLAEGD